MSLCNGVTIVMVLCHDVSSCVPVSIHKLTLLVTITHAKYCEGRISYFIGVHVNGNKNNAHLLICRRFFGVNL